MYIHKSAEIMRLLCVLIFMVMLHIIPLFGGVIPADPSSNDLNSLQLFISVTSGTSDLHYRLRQSIRDTWMKPCLASPVCDYRFFVDAPPIFITSALINENVTHRDMVFRDSCALMNRHSDTVNYGNTAPTRENLFYNLTVNNVVVQTVKNPDYEDRRLYKIDWKVCFMRWCVQHQRNAEYHVFVEDDSFLCTHNLLHQVNILHNISRNFDNSRSTQTELHRGDAAFLPFRTGFPSIKHEDGFDDSSTFMSGAIATAFAYYYRKIHFDCKQVDLRQFDALSWGNSWRSRACNWREVLKNNVHTRMSINIPVLNCSKAIDAKEPAAASVCPRLPLIVHHKFGGDFILSLYNSSEVKAGGQGDGLTHLCENLLLLDKVKDVQTMQKLWESTSNSQHFHNFSSVFMHDGTDGWTDVLSSMRRSADVLAVV